MNEFETELDFAGEPRPVRVTWDSVWGDLYLERIEVGLDVNETYTSLGIYDPRIERRWLDVTSIISDRQALELTREIHEALARQRADAYDDGRLQDWEERRQYAKAA